MMIQGRLMPARFIELRQVFAKKGSDTFLAEWYGIVLVTKVWYCTSDKFESSFRQF